MAEFLVGAVFELNAAPAIESLNAIGRAFERLAELATSLQERLATVGEAAFTKLTTGIDQAQSAMTRMLEQTDALTASWNSAAAAAERYAAATGSAVSREEGAAAAGAGTRRTAAAEEAALGGSIFGTAEERANADWENRNRDQVYRNQRRLAEQENADLAAARRERDQRAAAAGAVGGGLLHGMWPLIGGLGAFEAEKAAMEEDRALSQAIQEMGFHADDKRYGQFLEELRRAVVSGTEGTIFSEAKGAGAIPGTAGQFGAVFATPEERLRNYEAFLPSALRFAEVGKQYGRGDVTSNLEAAISYAHMTQRYGGPEGSLEAEKLRRGLDELLFLSLATKESVTGEQGILKYSVPLGVAAGLGADETAALTAFFQVLGFQGTTSATGLGQMLMGLTQTGGPLAAQMAPRAHELEKQFEDALHLKPEAAHAVHKGRGSEHIKAMQDLGLFDAAGHVRQDVAPGGKLDRNVFLQHIEDYLVSHTPMEDLATLRNAFTVRGSREAAMLQNPEVITRLNTFMENALHPRSVTDLQRESQMRPLSQFEQMLANIANIGNTLATATLGPLNTAFQTLNTYLIGFNEFLKEHQGVAKTVGWAGLGIAGAGAVGVAGGLGRWVWQNGGLRWLWNAGRGAVGAAAEGAAGAEAGGALGPLGLLGITASAGKGALDQASDKVVDMIGGPGTAARQRRELSQGAPPWLPQWLGGQIPLQPGDIGYSGPGSPGSLPGPRVGAAPQSMATPPPQPANVNVNIGTVTVPPEMQTWYDSVASKLKDAIKTGLEHATSAPAGTDMSPYVYPGGGL